MRITRPRHPLQGKSLPVLGGMRRHGEPELLLVLPDGSKSLIRADWTDAAQPGADDVVGVATLGSLTDLLRACKLVADLLGREPEGQGQAAGMSPCKEDSCAACPAEFDTRPAPGGDTVAALIAALMRFLATSYRAPTMQEAGPATGRPARSRRDQVKEEK